MNPVWVPDNARPPKLDVTIESARSEQDPAREEDQNRLRIGLPLSIAANARYEKLPRKLNFFKLKPRVTNRILSQWLQG